MAALTFGAPAAAGAGPQTVAQAAAAQGTIAGRVTTSDGKPISDAQITVRGAGATSGTRSGADGSFRLAVPPGLYTIVVVRGGYNTAEIADQAVIEGGTVTLAVPLAEANLSSLQVIGRTATNRRNPINTNVSSVSSISADRVAEVEPAKLGEVVAQLPGVTLDRGNSTPNASFVVRGGRIETRVQIDGHPVAQGQSGTYNLGYVAAATFGSVEVTKGPGLFGPNAGESAYGTVNLRTPDFVRGRNFGTLTQGFDSNNGSYTKLFANANALNDKLNLVVADTVFGTRGPQNGTPGYRTPGVGASGFAGSGGLVNFIGTLSSENTVRSELAKLRYNFSNSTSLSLEYLGLHGQQAPQGGSYNTYYGTATVPACAPASSESACGPLSLYNAPNARYLIGAPIPSTAAWFANSIVQYNEPNFIGEFRTALHNDTILIRPYSAVISRFIDGSGEARQVGNVSGLTGEAAWYIAPNAAACQSAFGLNATKTGYNGYCFQGNAAGNAFVGGPYTTAANPCPTVVFGQPLPSNACYIAKTKVTNNGSTQYGGPFSQLEFDRVHGLTFQYAHPMGENAINFTYDYNSDDTLYYSGDVNLPPPGTPLTLANQPALSVPPTLIRRNSFGLVFLLNPTSKLQLGIGNYLTNWNARYQLENPAAIAAYVASTPACLTNPPGAACNPNNAAFQLLAQTRSLSHYDPHVGLTYRLDRDRVLRFSAGSAISTPYASQISGLTVLSNTITNNSYNVTVRNTNLQPETTVAYDLGGDARLHDGSVLSMDLYSNTTFGAFATNVVPYTGPSLGTPAGVPVNANTTVNAAQFRDYGVELSLSKSPVVGFGYRLDGSLQRAFYANLGRDIYPANGAGTSQLINGKQVDGTPTYVPFSQGYAEISYAGSPETRLSLGMQYYGANNSTVGPAYTMFNASWRFPVADRLRAQVSVDNLFNTTIGTLSPAWSNQGNAQITAGYDATGKFIYSSRPSNLQAIAPRLYRFELTLPLEGRNSRR